MIHSPGDKSPKTANLYCYSNYRKLNKVFSEDRHDKHDGRSYKLQKFDGTWRIVPRESTIHKVMRKYSQAAMDLNGYTLQPYMGKTLEKTAYDPYGWIISFEELIQLQVRGLPVFNSNPCTLYYKGKKHSNDTTCRQYTVQKPNELPIGCIDFEIRFEDKNIYVSHLGIDPKVQKSGIGTILLHMIMDICTLYGFKQVHLQSLNKAISFYYGQGFHLQDDEFTDTKAFQEYLDTTDEAPYMFLDLLDESTMAKIDAKHVKTFKTEPNQFPATLLAQCHWMYEKSNYLEGLLAMLNDVKYTRNPNKALLNYIHERTQNLAKEVIISQEFFEEFNLGDTALENTKKRKAQFKGA